ncbi:MAG: hypothetical protein A4S09_12450 [Proteobacteria bacterium SG_bin7]|nr:MAG: hypothetical protein A4S09_12450 [Proteobacteria bacterium SG_bin7]
MNNPVRKWFGRAPRYVLRPEDNQFVRFANEIRQKSTGIEILDISKTGMAFTVRRENAPRLSENIIIEFEAPGTGQIACYARVVRLEEQSERASWGTPKKAVIVAVQFLLKKGQIKHLGRGLEEKFEQLKAQKNREVFRRRIETIKENTKLTILYLAVIFALVFVFYFLTQPRKNYNKNQTIPWGTRNF